MKFNYDLITWIDYFIGAFICCFGGLVIGKTLLSINFKDIKKYKLLFLIPFAIFTIFNTLLSDSIIKIIGVLIIDMLIYKIILEKRTSKIILYSIITIIIMSLAEIIYALFIAFFDYVFNFTIANNVSNTIYSNIIIAFNSYLITKLVKDKVKKTIGKISKVNFIIYFPIIITFFIMISSINYLYYDQWKLNYRLILVSIIMFGSVILSLTFIREYIKNKEVILKHHILKEYLKTSSDLIEKYSSSVHRNKNNLIVIRGFLKYGKIDEANKYINNLLESIKYQKYSWVSKINYISNDSIRYMVYHKLSQAEKSNLKITVNVSKDISYLDYNSFITIDEIDLILDIIGEYLDNAIYASNESTLKEINLDYYLENNNLIFLISNTYKNKINLDLITKNGYSTKGKGRGIGLYDINKIIKSVDKLSHEYEKIDNYFVAKLIIDTKKN